MLILNNTAFLENIAEESGGAISLNSINHDVHICNSKFYRNSAAREGGAIFFSVYYMTQKNLINVSNSNFTENHAGEFGGAFFCIDGIVLIDHSYFSRWEWRGHLWLQRYN